MGQKVHPGGMRVGVIHPWKSNWYTGKKKLAHAGLSDILIRKDKQRITVDIYTARPGIVIGKSGVEVDALRKELHAITKKNVHININEIKRPELDAKLVAQSIAEQLQNRVSFRRAMKRALASGIRSGAKGVRIQCGGGGGRGAPRDRARAQDNVERPRPDEAAKSAEGREQPVIEPEVATAPPPVADAPDTTTSTQSESPEKKEKSEDAAKSTRRRTKKEGSG